MAVDFGARVRVNAIEPAAIDTGMLRASFERHESDFRQLAACHPQGRLGSPEEVASLVYSVAAGEFRFLHGASIDLSGGIAARMPGGSKKLLDPLIALDKKLFSSAEVWAIARKRSGQVHV